MICDGAGCIFEEATLAGNGSSIIFRIRASLLDYGRAEKIRVCIIRSIKYLSIIPTG